jgi:DNA-binding Xre family transcriptional regulator
MIIDKLLMVVNSEMQKRAGKTQLLASFVIPEQNLQALAKSKATLLTHICYHRRFG